MIDKSYAAMQYALFIKDVKDKFFLPPCKERKNSFAGCVGFKEKCTRDPLREISWENCGVNDGDLTCSFSH